jgi:hypothetical protein
LRQDLRFEIESRNTLEVKRTIKLMSPGDGKSRRMKVWEYALCWGRANSQCTSIPTRAALDRWLFALPQWHAGTGERCQGICTVYRITGLVQPLIHYTLL